LHDALSSEFQEVRVVDQPKLRILQHGPVLDDLMAIDGQILARESRKLSFRVADRAESRRQTQEFIDITSFPSSLQQ
jgi:hypothetical protein